MKTGLAIGVLALGLCVESSAQAELLRNFQVANWFVGVYSSEGSKTFHHCAASAKYNSGISVLFSINRDYRWSMGFAHPQWRLTNGQRYDVAFSIDGGTPIFAKANAYLGNAVEVFLADSSELFT